MQNNDTRSLWDDIRDHVLLLGGLQLLCGLLGVLCFTFLAIWIVTTPEKRIETTDISDFGNYTGTSNDQKITEYINSFFPEKIENHFTDVTFSYRATNMGSYACEAYLEFRIRNKDELNQHISNIADKSEWQDFQYNSCFKEYCIDDTLYLSLPPLQDGTGNSSPNITDANIRKVLYSAEDGTIIYLALIVCNDSVVETNYFNAFFSRFNIDPVEYEKNSVSFSKLSGIQGINKRFAS